MKKMKQQTNKIEWREVKLGEICNLVTDGTHEKTPLVDKKEGMPLITSKDLTEKGISFENVLYITKEQHREIIKRSKPEKGDILYSKIGTIGKPTIVDVDFEFSIKNVALFKLKKGLVSNKFIVYYLKSSEINEMLNKTAGGGNQKFIPLMTLRKVRVALPFRNGHPDLEEQERIVKILEKAERLKEKSKQANELMDEYLKSVFNEMFYNKSYPCEKLKKLTIKIATKNPAKEFPEEYFNYVDISSIDNNLKKIVSTNKLLGKEAPSRAKQQVKTKDIILSTVRPNLNAVALITKELNNQICSTGFCVLRLDKDKAIAEYIFMNLIAKRFVESMTKISKGASYPAVSDKDILDFEIPLPPLALQQRFASVVEHVEKIKEKQQQSKQQIEELFNSLMQRAFNGELIK